MIEERTLKCARRVGLHHQALEIQLTSVRLEIIYRLDYITHTRTHTHATCINMVMQVWMGS